MDTTMQLICSFAFLFGVFICWAIISFLSKMREIIHLLKEVGSQIVLCRQEMDEWFNKEKILDLPELGEISYNTAEIIKILNKPEFENIKNWLTPKEGAK